MGKGFMRLKAFTEIANAAITERVANARGASPEPASGLQRPAYFKDFVGQREAVQQLDLMCKSAKTRKVPVDHLLMKGPGGLGKTTLALMIATEMDGQLFSTTAPTLGPETLGKILSTSPSGFVLFIDEFHGLGKQTSELLYAAMEDGWIDVPSKVGPERRSVKPFTLVGATTEPGALSESMKDRFGHIVELTFYDRESMMVIAQQSADKLGLVLMSDTTEDIADRSRGIPRVLNTYLKRIRDYVLVQHEPEDGARILVDLQLSDDAFEFFGVDGLGLTAQDREYMTLLITKFRGGPVGEQNLAIRLGVDAKTITRDIEPYLMRLGLINRANLGRIATEGGRAYVRNLLGEGDE